MLIPGLNTSSKKIMNNELTDKNRNDYYALFSMIKKIRSVGIPVDREDLVYEYTGGRTKSLRELTPAEYEGLIKWLSRQIDAHNSNWQNSPENQMRRKIIALFYKMGYRVTTIGYQHPSKADMTAIKVWVMKYGYLHKDLNEYTVEELPKLVTQVEEIYRKHMEKYG